MRKATTLPILLFLLIAFISSCTSHRDLHFAQGFAIKSENNSIEQNGLTILKVEPSVLNLKNKGLIFDRELLSKDFEKHIASILCESNSIKDNIITASQDFIIIQNRNKKQLEINYLYHFDLELGRWVCMCQNSPRNMLSSPKNPYIFSRSVYVREARNRMIIKDSFGDVSVIYVIQGKDDETNFYTTSIWNPAKFNDFITISNYINQKIDPISYSIAKNK